MKSKSTRKKKKASVPKSPLPRQALSQDQAFQSNLLSLISHELRTPLTGIINALTVLESGEAEKRLPEEELIQMASRNARKLQEQLATILDLATIESGHFHARLKEIDFRRIVLRVFGDCMHAFSVKNLHPVFSTVTNELVQGIKNPDLFPVLADPQKLSRAVELIFQIIAQHADPHSDVLIKKGAWRLDVTFSLSRDAKLQGLPREKFFGIFGSQEQFLTRTQEGLGSEIALIEQLMKIQHGKFFESIKKNQMTLSLELAKLPAKQGLHAVISSRVYETSTGVGSIALALIRIPEKISIDAFTTQIRALLFRATDAAYVIPEDRAIALVLNDCKPEDAPKMLHRIERGLQKRLAYGYVTCPEEGTDPEFLISMVERRLAKQLQTHPT